MTVIAYFDSSALVKLLLDEPDSDVVHRLWNHTDSVAASPLAFVEVSAALATSQRTRRIALGAHRRLVDEWNEAWMAVRSVELDGDLTMTAGRLAAAHGLSGADAVHLASALAIGREHVVMTVFDRRLHQAAQDEGLATVPAKL